DGGFVMSLHRVVPGGGGAPVQLHETRESGPAVGISLRRLAGQADLLGVEVGEDRLAQGFGPLAGGALAALAADARLVAQPLDLVDRGHRLLLVLEAVGGSLPPADPRERQIVVAGPDEGPGG